MKKSLAGHAVRGILHWRIKLAVPTTLQLMLLKKRAENRIGRFALL
ncbi:hypothetical protein [Herbaspirillum sp. NPDC101396]